MNRKWHKLVIGVLALISCGVMEVSGREVVRVFIFAGQSNMEGADSRVSDIKQFPPFSGLEQPQEEVLFSYLMGRENKVSSDGWVALQPVNNWVGPELSFARELRRHSQAPIAIIKCAAGGTHLGGDWNPDNPQRFKLYPLTLKLIKDSLAQLDAMGHPWQIEGFFWHQGENDMFEEHFLPNYGRNLERFIARWRKDLDLPQLPFFVGELCTKTIWGMDLRPRMYAISLGQKEVTSRDANAAYVPTSHIASEIGNPYGLHYHYGTLGQLEHGINYAHSYLKSKGLHHAPERNLTHWPYPDKSKVNLFILAGHRNMEGERAFIQQVPEKDTPILRDNHKIAFKYNLGGNYRKSRQWEPLGTVGYYDTFGPELSFGHSIQHMENVAIAKFTHSGSQIIDWTPDGSMAHLRHIYPKFIRFIKDAILELEELGHTVEVKGILYHVGENDMSFFPYRRNAASRVGDLIRQSRGDLKMPDLKWFVSQQPPTDHKDLNRVDVLTEFKNLAEMDPNTTWIPALDLPPQPKKLVLNTDGIIELGRLLAKPWHND